MQIISSGSSSGNSKQQNMCSRRQLRASAVNVVILCILAAQSVALCAADMRPRLVPLVASESGYSENSSVNVLCTVSQGVHDSLAFEWFKDGQPLSASDQVLLDSSSSSGKQAVHIEKHPDHSLLRIARVSIQHAGRYTCAARNQFGQDSSSVALAVNGNYFERARVSYNNK